jgi:hypothetical protein
MMCPWTARRALRRQRSRRQQRSRSGQRGARPKVGGDGTLSWHRGPAPVYAAMSVFYLLLLCVNTKGIVVDPYRDSC